MGFNMVFEEEVRTMLRWVNKGKKMKSAFCDKISSFTTRGFLKGETYSPEIIIQI